MRSGQRGFTLIEILVVILLIAILSSVAIATAAGSLRGSRDSQRAINAQSIARKLEQYYKLNISPKGATYPTRDEVNEDAYGIIGDREVLRTPGNDDGLISADNRANTDNKTRQDRYVYQPFDESGNLCDASPCVRFELYYYREQDDSVYKIESMRQQ